MGNIDWLPIADLPEVLKDGRDVLLATTNTLGTAYGGDGKMLDPKHPYFYFVGCWRRDEWDTGDDSALGSEPSHFAEITPPT